MLRRPPTPRPSASCTTPPARQPGAPARTATTARSHCSSSATWAACRSSRPAGRPTSSRPGWTSRLCRARCCLTSATPSSAPSVSALTCCAHRLQILERLQAHIHAAPRCVLSLLQWAPPESKCSRLDRARCRERALQHRLLLPAPPRCPIQCRAPLQHLVECVASWNAKRRAE
jgi:hypothetical protein